MMNASQRILPARISLLEFLSQRGWKPTRDNGREEVAGLCPLHQDSHPSFYVNSRKQVFYFHAAAVAAAWPGWPAYPATYPGLWLLRL
jgi:hypothetical protein